MLIEFKDETGTVYATHGDGTVTIRADRAAVISAIKEAADAIAYMSNFVQQPCSEPANLQVSR